MTYTYQTTDGGLRAYGRMLFELLYFAVVLLLISVIGILLSPFRLVWVALRGAQPPPNTFQSVLITGASSGIGEEWAYLWASEGARLVLIARRKEELEKVAAKCRQLGAKKVKVVIGSVADKDFMERVINEADDEQELDLVLANAGVIPHAMNLADPLKQAIYPCVEVNCLGVVYTCQPAAMRFRERKRGQIAIVSSAAAFFKPATTLFSAYTTSKVFANEYARQLRIEMASYNVGVSLVTPGYVESAMTENIQSHQPKTIFMGITPAKQACAYMKAKIELNDTEIYQSDNVIPYMIIASATPLPYLASYLALGPLNAIFMGPENKLF